MPTPLQNSVFEVSTGISMTASSYAIAVAVVGLSFVWAAWVVAGQARAWAANRIDFYQLLWSVLRVSLVLIILGTWISP